MKNIYLKVLGDYCDKVDYDCFPSADDLMYKIIRLKDIYSAVNINPDSIIKYNVDYTKSGIDYDKKVQESLNSTVDYADALSSKERVASGSNKKPSIDLDDLIKRIDERIAAMEKDFVKLSETDIDNNEKIENNSSDPTAMRLVIRGKPGSGKTIFIKRLCLAYCRDDVEYLKNEADFAEFPLEQFPVLILCRYFNQIEIEEIKNRDFLETVYKLIKLTHGDNLPESFCYENFVDIIYQKLTEGKLLFLIDGWDELLDKSICDLFLKKFNTFVEKNKNLNVIVTARDYYECDEFSSYNFYKISDLDDNQIEGFVKRWYKIIYSTQPEKQKNYKALLNQLGIGGSQSEPRFLYAKKFTDVPLSLSCLLLATRNTGSIPDMKCHLFDEIFTLYVRWHSEKKWNRFSETTLKYILSYIAISLTKDNKLFYNYDELTEVFRNCYRDLDGYFPVPMYEDNIPKDIEELCRCGLFGFTIGDLFGFRAHRQMQEYLSACAINNRLCDQLFDYQNPIEIFSDKYKNPRWKEVILFTIESAQYNIPFVEALIASSKNENTNYACTNLLFELMLQNLPLRAVYQEKLYKCIFEEHITDKQVEMIVQLLSHANSKRDAFVEFITKEFRSSVENGDVKFMFAFAVIESYNSIRNDESPLTHAEALLCKDDEFSKATGMYILCVMAWCFYARVGASTFEKYYKDFKLSDKTIAVLADIVSDAENKQKTDAARCVQDCFLAEYMLFSDFQIYYPFEEMIDDFEKNSDDKAYEKLLPLAPINYTKAVNAELQEKYLSRLKSEIAEHDRKTNDKRDDIIFTFSLCNSIGCFENNDYLVENYIILWDIYSMNTESMGGARFKQMRSELGYLLKQNIGEEKYLIRSVSFEPNLLWHNLNLNKEAQIAQKCKLSAYVRQKKIVEVRKFDAESERYSIMVNASDLIKEGVAIKEPFSLINKALLISEVFGDSCDGDLSKGLEFLKDNGLTADNIKMVKDQLLINLNLNEDWIVLLWLYELSGSPEVFNGIGNNEISKIKSPYLKEKVVETISPFIKKSFIENLEIYNEIKAALENTTPGDQMRFQIVNDKGKTVECEVLFTFEQDEIQYIVYTDNSVDDEENTKVYASRYKSGKEGPITLYPIESEEWNMIEIIIDEIQNQIQNGEVSDSD